jgi:hypothetical protein
MTSSHVFAPATTAPGMPAAALSGARPEYRGQRILAVAAMLVAVAIGLPRFLTHSPYSRFGVQLVWPHETGPPVVDKVVGPPSEGLLLHGDALVAVNGEVLTRQVMREHFRNGWPRGPLELVIERGGRRIETVLPPVRLGAWQRVRIYTLPLAAVIAVPIVAFLLVWRRPDLGTAWVFLWFAIQQGMGAIYDLFRFPPAEYGGGFKLYLQLYHGLTFFYPAAFIHFMTVFPRPRWAGRRPWQSAWFWVVVLVYVLAPVMPLLARAWGRPVDDVFTWFDIVVVALGTLALVERYVRPGRPDWNPGWSERAVALVVAVAMFAATLFSIFGALESDPRILAMLMLPMTRVIFSAVLLAWLGSPLLIALLIANDPAFDPRRLIVRSIPYALLSGVLAGLYLGIVLLAQRMFAAATGEDAMVFNVVAALVVAFAFAPFRGRLQRAIDRLYGRDPQALRRALDRCGQELLSALDRDEVRAAVEAGLASGLKHMVTLEWPATGPPRVRDPEEIPEEARAAVDNVLAQAGIRLENLALQEQRAAAERHAVELREAATRAELRALQAQVQPHFLFNALNALSYLTETDPPAAQRFTERLADMLRYTVEAGARPAALLSEELAFVEDYLGVARERYETPLEFKAGVAPELLSTAVPPLLLQPLVENSLKHGCGPDSHGLHLSLEACREQGWFTLRFADDGAASGNGAPGLGVGLANLAQRVLRFAGPQASMDAGPAPGGGFAVTLRWPVTAAPHGAGAA